VLRRTAASLCALLLTLACAEKVANMEGGPQLLPLVGAEGVYTLVNLHPDEVRARLYAANYQQDGLIPLCSPVRLDTLTSKRLTFTVLKTGKTYTYDYHKAAVEPFPAHLSRYFGTVCNTAAVERLSPVDRKGIQMGKALEGMTRQGVIYAMGYPPPHRTPSLDGDRWIYWRNRFDTFAVVFDQNGRVMGIED
jgi:hypothetical protein